MDPTRQQCEANLRARFNEYRNLINTATEDDVFEAVDAYVDCLRREGMTPEAMVVALKKVAISASETTLTGDRRREETYVVSSRLNDIISRAIQRYFGNMTPAKGFRSEP